MFINNFRSSLPSILYSICTTVINYDINLLLAQYKTIQLEENKLCKRYFKSNKRKISAKFKKQDLKLQLH